MFLGHTDSFNLLVLTIFCFFTLKLSIVSFLKFFFQYEKSFSAQRLQNWQIPKNFKEVTRLLSYLLSLFVILSITYCFYLVKRRSYIYMMICLIIFGNLSFISNIPLILPAFSPFHAFLSSFPYLLSSNKNPLIHNQKWFTIEAEQHQQKVRHSFCSKGQKIVEVNIEKEIFLQFKVVA